jgi:valyl-tRNA synthetase
MLYHFIWHRFADYYVEELKDELRNGNIRVLDVLSEVFFENLKMLHPFIPFITEAIWQQFKGNEKSILLEKL